MVVGTQNSGPGPGQARKARPGLRVAKWEVLQAFTEAGSQTACPQLLLKAGTGLEQPFQRGPVKSALEEACLICGPTGGVKRQRGSSLPHYWQGTPLHSCLLALTWGSTEVGRRLHESLSLQLKVSCSSRCGNIRPLGLG